MLPERLTPYREWTLIPTLPPEWQGWVEELGLAHDEHARLVYRGISLRIFIGRGEAIGIVGADVFSRVALTANRDRNDTWITRLGFDMQSFVDAMYDTGSL